MLLHFSSELRMTGAKPIKSLADGSPAVTETEANAMRCRQVAEMCEWKLVRI
jgi:hypothetical protein